MEEITTSGYKITVKMHKKESHDGSKRWIGRIKNLLYGQRLVPTPLEFTMQTLGLGRMFGDREFILRETLRAEQQFIEFTNDPSKLTEWVEKESKSQVQFYLRPGGLISRIPEDERPTREEVLSWIPVIDKLEVGQSSTILPNDSEE